MAKVRCNGRVVNFQARREYRARKAGRKHERNIANGRLNTVMRQLWNRQRKQNNRWLRAKVESINRGGIPFDVECELVQLFRAASKKEQEKPRLHPGSQLSGNAMRLWKELKAERTAAMVAQDQRFEADDWWLERGAGEEGKKTTVWGQMEEVTTMMAMLGVKGEEYVVENEDGDFVVMSPEGSVVGEGEEGEDEGGVEVS